MGDVVRPAPTIGRKRCAARTSIAPKDNPYLIPQAYVSMDVSDILLLPPATVPSCCQLVSPAFPAGADHFVLLHISDSSLCSKDMSFYRDPAIERDPTERPYVTCAIFGAPHMLPQLDPRDPPRLIYLHQARVRCSGNCCCASQHKMDAMIRGQGGLWRPRIALEASIASIGEMGMMTVTHRHMVMETPKGVLKPVCHNAHLGLGRPSRDNADIGF